MGIAAGMNLAAAELVNGVAPGDRAGLLRAGHALLYVHAVHSATTHTQDPRIWPLLYTAACALNAAKAQAGAATTPDTSQAATSMPVGGLMPAAMLRPLEQRVLEGDTASALTVARRYLQMGHAPRALAGIIGGAAAARDSRSGESDAVHILP